MVVAVTNAMQDARLSRADAWYDPLVSFAYDADCPAPAAARALALCPRPCPVATTVKPV